MPHITVEYSANLEPRVDMARLLRAAHGAALATGVFKLGAVRTRAERRDLYVVADGALGNAFVSVQVRIGVGRYAATRKALGGAIFEAVSRELDGVYADTPLGLTLEVLEIDETAAFRRNNLHERMEGKSFDSESFDSENFERSASDSVR